MGNTVRFHVDGLRELGQELRKLGDAVRLKFADRAVGSGAQVIKRFAKQKLKTNPSIDSGLVEKNVIAKRVPKGQRTVTAEYVVTVKKVVYPLKGNQRTKRNTRQVAGYLEYGTVKMPAEPFLRPAIDEHHPEATSAIVTSLRANIATSGITVVK